MFENILTKVEEVFPSSDLSVSQDVWDNNIPLFCEQLYIIGSDIFSIIVNQLSKRPLLESKNEVVTSCKPMIQICENRLRPKSDYYAKFGLPIPSPENPTGPHATGVELSLCICKGHTSNGTIVFPYAAIDFKIWGNRERLAFMELFKDHRRYIEKLISTTEFEFTTACWFENVEKYKKKNAFKKLDLYFQNSEDSESSFTITKTFSKNASLNEIITALLPLAILYDATLGYCLHKNDKDRIFQYIGRI